MAGAKAKTTAEGNFQMKRWMINTLLTFGSCIGLLFAGGAAAVVTIDQVAIQEGPLEIGDLFDIDILLSWDGTGSLDGIFVSHQWDRDQLQLVDAVWPLMPGVGYATAREKLTGTGSSVDPFLRRSGTIAEGLPSEDSRHSARTIHYFSRVLLRNILSAETDTLVTRLTFRVVGVGDGIAEVTPMLLSRGVGAWSDTLVLGAEATIAIVPEPSVTMLMGLGLGGLVVAGRRKD